MPYTINGIGTTYAFSSAKSSYFGTCEFCGKEGILKSYDTWNAFCFLFIPLIPLRKRRILDECSSCQRHRYLPIKEWEARLAGTMAPLVQALNQNPGDVKVLTIMVETMLGLSMTTEAKNAIQAFVNQYGENSETTFYRGVLAMTMAKWQEAIAYFEAAIRLEPKVAKYHSRLGSAHWESGQREQSLQAAIRACDLDPDNPGYWQVRAFRAYLLRKYQDALAAFDKLIALNPALASDSSIRNAMDMCRELIKNPNSSHQPPLPDAKPFKPPSKFLRRVLAAVLVLGLLFTYFGGSYMAGQSRELRMFNDLQRDVVVKISDRTFPIKTQSETTVQLMEGKHVIVVTDTRGEQLDATTVQIESNFFGRLFADPVFVYNVGGIASFLWEQQEYSSRANKLYENRLVIGQPFIAYPDIDYRFKPFPESIRTKSSSVRKTRFSKINVATAQVVGYLLQSKQDAEAVELMQRVIRFNPGDALTLQYFYAYLLQTGKANEAIAYVRQVAGNDPEKVLLQRFLQDVGSREQGNSLETMYRKLLDEHPQSAAAHYLYGRILSDHQSSHNHFRKALELDPTLTWAVWALANQEVREGKYREAEVRLQPILTAHDPIRGTPPETFRQIVECKYGLGQYAAAANLLNLHIDAHPDDKQMLFEYFAVAGKLGVKNQLEQMLQKVKKFKYLEADLAEFGLLYAYAAADVAQMQALLARSEAQKNGAMSWGKLQLALLLGESVTPALVTECLESDGTVRLNLILCALAPDLPQSQLALHNTQKIKNATDGFAQTASYILGEATLDSVMGCQGQLLPEERRCLFLAAAIAAERRNRPEEAKQLLAVASQVNFRPTFPYHTITLMASKYR